MLSKNDNTKKCVRKLVFYNEKKIEEDLDIFEQKIDFKVKF